MSSRWKNWLATGSALLLIGAGCAGSSTTNEGAQNGYGSGTQDQGSLRVKADAAFDAAVDESDAAAKQELEESGDADVVTNDASELKAYGTVYDQNSL